MKKIIAIILLIVVVAGLAGCAALQDETINAIANEAFTAVVKIVAQLVMAAFGIGLTWLTVKLGKTEKFKALTEVLGQLSATVNETVGELQQTIVDEMKAASADGKLTQDEISKLNLELLARVKNKMAQPAIDMLVAAQVDINALIHGMAESVINDMHKSRQTIPGAIC